MTNKKFIWLQHNNNLSYNDEGCYLNEKKINNTDQNSEESANSRQKAFSSQKALYNSFFKKTFKNVVVLTAAGTSIDNGGKSREQLWEYCTNEIEKITNEIKDLNEKDFCINKDIEALLSHIILYEKLNGEIKDNEEKILRKELEKRIVEACNLKIKKGDETHQEFLNKITARKLSDPRVKLFTLNYDLLFEQAANNAGFTIIDGFSFSHPRTFSGKYFDLDIVNREKTRIKNEESFESKVFHLYKMHGSLNWHKNGDKIEQKENPKDPLIIYPANEKYESSYEQPYFEMMSRFQQALRKENTLLIVIGFGFGDKHIQNVINEAVEQNSSFQLVVLKNKRTDGDGIKFEYFTQFFDKENNIKRNVTIIYDSFKDFVEKYPSNNTYLDREDKGDGGSNEAF